MNSRTTFGAFAIALLGSCCAASADEGMWTFDNFPGDKVKAAYGAAPTQQFLDHVRESSLRIAGGCSASFVSATGLVMTNHHCALGCIEQLSSPQNDYVENGFLARSGAEEKRCPDIELDRLDRIEDVTAAMTSATAGLSGAAFSRAQRTERAALSATCPSAADVRCDVVELYHGGVYDLYHYKKYTDVRLVFAPEFAVAQFGGDPDNFNFPRFDFDISMLRAYENGTPAETPEHLTFAPNGSAPGDLVYVSGNPGGTSRELTTSQLAFDRDVDLPATLPALSELRGIMERFATEGAEQAREVRDALFGLENRFKVSDGRLQALDDPAFFAAKAAQERDLRDKVAARPDLAASVGDPWSAIAGAEQLRRDEYDQYRYIAVGPPGSLWRYARTLVRLPVELAKPNASRLAEFSDAARQATVVSLLADKPVYPAIEEFQLANFFSRMRRDLGPDDPFVRKVLGDRTPDALAHELVSGTRLGDAKMRAELASGGAAAVAASHDPLVRLVASIDDVVRVANDNYQNGVTAPVTSASAAIAKARFAIYGASIDPDATFTLRLSYGKVDGFTDARGRAVKPYTTMVGLFARATGAEPFVLPKSWLAAKSSLDLATPMNLSTTNDIIGGNSGSPMIDARGRVVGLVFDGNIYSLGGNYGYDGARNRSVALDSRAIVAALREVYHADALAAEMLGR